MMINSITVNASLRVDEKALLQCHTENAHSEEESLFLLTFTFKKTLALTKVS